jgi:hypothetical protein
MNVKQLLNRDFGIEVRISAGTGRSEDPYVLEKCRAEEAALTQVQLLRGIGNGLGELWRIIEWAPLDRLDTVTEVIRIEAVRFTQEKIETSRRRIFFDIRAVSGHPNALHPLICWRGPMDAPHLPYELGWLHFDKVINNASGKGPLDQTICYSGTGAKASVYVYARPPGEANAIRDAELERAAMIVSNPELKDPWPVIEAGPFAMNFFISGDDITAVGVAVSGQYFIKYRLTYFDDPIMRELMSATINALRAYVGI